MRKFFRRYDGTLAVLNLLATMAFLVTARADHWLQYPLAAGIVLLAAVTVLQLIRAWLP